MRILVACEFSGIIREAFRKKGHDAWSCDLLDTEIIGNHFQGDIFDFLDEKNINWDIIIAHPPCTYLCRSGARWWKERKKEQKDAINFVLKLEEYCCYYANSFVIENPVGILSTVWRKPDQYIQPYQFGHPETKKTGLWLFGLPKLKSTNIVDPISCRVHYYSGKDRWKKRSRTYTGIANAMSDQWNKFKEDTK